MAFQILRTKTPQEMLVLLAGIFPSGPGQGDYITIRHVNGEWVAVVHNDPP